MTSVKVFATILLSAAIISAQQIPPGTALPLRLNSTLDSRKAKAGQPISADIAQDVPLPGHAKIRARSRVRGSVLAAGVNPDGSSYLRIRFDRLHTRNGDLPITASLRALASLLEVRDAQLPSHTPYRGETAYDWTTAHVGGDDVYGVGGPAMHGDEEVGVGVYGGVLSELHAVPSSGCETDSGKRRLALWVFSSYACGVYGFDDLAITHPGATKPFGEIVLASKKNVHVPSGAGLLLITLEAP
jgi:hypothetical protein